MYIRPEREHSYSREHIERDFVRRKYRQDYRRENKKTGKKVRLAFIFMLLIVAGILIKLWLDTNPFKVPGKVEYDSSITEEEKTILEKNKELWEEEHKYLNHDVSFSAKTTYELPDLTDSVLTAVEVPTVDFYDNELKITDAEKDDKNIKWVDIRKLTPESRVVAIDDNYYFDNIEKGARFRVITYKTVDDTKEAAEFLIKNGDKTIDELNVKTEDYLSFAQTGVTAITRAMTTTLNGRAGGRGSYFADKIKDFLSSKDLTHISNEVSFTNGCKGSRDTMSLCADWRTLDTIKAIGTDIVELSGNHNNNYGYDANTKTINKYHDEGMDTVGGGLNETEAAKPLEIDKKGNKITFLAYNQSTSTKGNGELANGNKPGANGYSEAKAKADIEEAKARGDFVLVDIQFAECYSYPDGYTEMPACDYPIAGQKALFRKMIDLGADMVVGTQAHHPQTFEIYDGKPIYYGLGNLFFDQVYWPGTQRGYILTHYFKDGKLLNTRLSPTWYDEKHQVYLMNEEKSESFIGRLIKASPEGK